MGGLSGRARGGTSWDRPALRRKRAGAEAHLIGSAPPMVHGEISTGAFRARPPRAPLGTNVQVRAGLFLVGREKLGSPSLLIASFRSVTSLENGRGCALAKK